jgi:hypothetical protein
MHIERGIVTAVIVWSKMCLVVAPSNSVDVHRTFGGMSPLFLGSKSNQTKNQQKAAGNN